MAYVKGIGNMADFETAAAGSNPPPCIAKGFVDELKAKTIAQVIGEVDKYYQENPAKMDTPVVACYAALHQALLGSPCGEKIMKITVILLVAGVMIGALAVAAPAVDTNQAFLWNGVHWQQVTTEGKAGYIFGIGNLADYEVAAAKGRSPACVSRVFVEEMKTKTVMQVIQEVDKYYQDNPEKLGTPVIEVVLGQLARPSSAPVPAGKTKK